MTLNLYIWSFALDRKTGESPPSEKESLLRSVGRCCIFSSASGLSCCQSNKERERERRGRVIMAKEGERRGEEGREDAR